MNLPPPRGIGRPFSRVSGTAAPIKETTVKPIKHAILVAAATVLFAGPLAAQTNAVSVSNECAQRDVESVTLLEQTGEAQDLPGYVLYETFMTVLRARAACNEGRVADGLALYDGIIRPVLAQRKQ
jgi:hypothetical protein